MMTAYNDNEQYDGFHIKHNDISNTLFIKACGHITDYDKAKKLIHMIFDGITNILRLKKYSFINSSSIVFNRHCLDALRREKYTIPDSFYQSFSIVSELMRNFIYIFCKNDIY